VKWPVRIIAILAFRAALPAWGQNVTVNHNPPTVQRRTFNPQSRPPQSRPPPSRPADMPRLGPGEDAVTQSNFGISTEVKVVVLSESKAASGKQVATVRIEEVSVTTNLDITLWLPTNTTRRLTRHEEGHQTLSEHFYEGSDASARHLAQRLIGQTFTGQGQTAQAARHDAIAKAIQRLGEDYMAAVQAPASRANELFDRLTRHGQNREISAQAAISSVLKDVGESSNSPVVVGQ
jgi:hypothetical protein